MLMAGRLVDGRLRVCTRVGGTANVRGELDKFTLYLFRFTFGSHWLPGNNLVLLVQRAIVRQELS